MPREQLIHPGVPRQQRILHLGQLTPSLDAIAAGEWPAYIALGQQAEEVAENDGPRN